MIEKERLEELIEQGATIWGVYDYTYSYDKPNKKVEHINLDMFYHYYKDIEEFIMYQGDYCNLFETEEEAEWYRDFGCIEKIERLELPTWEELQNKRDFYLGFNNKDGIVRYYLAIDMPYQKDYGAILISYSDANNDTIICFDEIATKENYTIACRKCKELFLGEKK